MFVLGQFSSTSGLREKARTLSRGWNKVWRHITAIRRVDATAGQEAERQRKAAKRSERRALVFLARQLNEVQRSEFRTFRYFHVTGGKSGDRYLIRPDKAANIDVLLADGRTKHRL